jgi:hypothetical protein
MTRAEMPELIQEPASPAAAFGETRPANDVATTGDAMASSALLRLGAGLVVAGAAVIVGVLMSAIAVSFGVEARPPVKRAPPASPRAAAPRRARASAPASPAST